METVAHMEQEKHFGCMFQTFHFKSSMEKIFPAQYAPAVQRSLTALFTMLLYPALYEFIIAQSPHTMKGLLVGLSFAIKGLFEFLGLAVVIREYGSTLYVGLARVVSPTKTNFRLTFLLTRLQEALCEDLAV